MKFSFFLSILLVAVISLSKCFLDPFSGITTAIATIGAGIAAYNHDYFRCKRAECCDRPWIDFDEQKLKNFLRGSLFGQHLAVDIVERALKKFHNNPNPKKALVLSFHGLTGSGKNFITTMIANSTYFLGTDSSFVHIYTGLKDFPHESKVAEYKDRIHRDIENANKVCGHSLFVFDEIDKMPPGTLDAVKPYVDYYDKIGGDNYRKNVFIFLSNAGSKGIVSIALEFWSTGRDRDEIEMRDIEPLIDKGAFNERGGFQYSELLRSELVDYFVPFLPLERKHVRQCIAAELARRGNSHSPDSHFVKKIAEELQYFPPEEQLYSKSGCKRIEQKVDMHED